MKKNEIKKSDGKEEEKYGGTLIILGLVSAVCGGLLLGLTLDQKLGEFGLALVCFGVVSIILGIVDLIKKS